jgi:hypothetical protein
MEDVKSEPRRFIAYLVSKRAWRGDAEVDGKKPAAAREVKCAAGAVGGRTGLLGSLTRARSRRS